jgi:H+/Cl- antiporter ClcA
MALCAGIGFVAGLSAEYIYLNLHPIERLVAETDGFPAWSLWQLPLALPGGIAGALLGTGAAAALRALRSRKGVNPPT